MSWFPPFVLGILLLPVHRPLHLPRRVRYLQALHSPRDLQWIHFVLAAHWHLEYLELPATFTREKHKWPVYVSTIVLPYPVYTTLQIHCPLTATLAYLHCTWHANGNMCFKISYVWVFTPAPAGPAAPAAPAGPLSPFGPFTPGCPVSPFTPLSPFN